MVLPYHDVGHSAEFHSQLPSKGMKHLLLLVAGPAMGWGRASRRLLLKHEAEVGADSRVYYLEKQ
jgi:hypothetical protein